MVYDEVDAWPQRWCEGCQAMTSTNYLKLVVRIDGMWLNHMRCGLAERGPDGSQLVLEEKT